MFLLTLTSFRSITKDLGQYPATLTSRLANNVYIYIYIYIYIYTYEVKCMNQIKNKHVYENSFTYLSEKKHFNLYGGKRELVIIKERKHSDVLKWQLLLSDHLVCVVLPSLSTSVLSVMVQLFVIRNVSCILEL